MKKIFLTVASLALLSNGSNLLAWAGGPFDNGDPGSLLMERGGFYQCQFSFSNGNGYGIFTPDAILAGNLPAASAQVSAGGGTNNQQVGIFNRGSLYTPNTNGANPLNRNANRSVFYYKGMTYVGGCFGFLDIEKREIQGTANANSDEQVSQQTLSQNTGGLVNAAQSAQTQQRIVLNNAGFILNLGWKGKINSTRPTLRFRGKGELAVLSPNGESTVSSLAFRGFSGLIDAIVSSVQNFQGPGSPNYTAAQTAIGDALTDLQTNYLSAGGADALYRDANKHPVYVTGNRRYF